MINKTYDAMIGKWIEDNRQWILDNWMDLVRIPSVRAEAEPLAPFGQECARAVKAAAEKFEKKGFAVRINEADGYALADSGEGDKTIAMFGHADVVPVGEGWEITEPFTPLIQDGRLFGRGASDDKSGIIASLCVMSMFRELGIPVKSRLRAFIGSNEESGMEDVMAFVRNERMPDLCLVPDGSFPCSLGEKGILRMWAQSTTPLTAIRRMRGGDAFNIVLDRVDTELAPNAALEAELRALCADSPACKLTVAADGTLNLRADGVAKHAGSPDGSVNAAYMTADLLARCQALPESDRRQMAIVAQYLSSPWGEGMGIDHTDPAFGKLTAVNGMVDVEDGCLKVSLDVRYGTALDHVYLERSLEEVWGQAGFAIVYMNDRPGYRVDPESPVPGMVRDICAQLTGIEKECYFMAGGTYGRYLKNTYTVGVCTDFEGRGELPPLPAGHGGAHQRDEAISIEGFLMSVRILAHIVLGCDKLIHGEV